MYKPDLIIELEDKIIIIEFQSSPVYAKEKRRFRFYTALFDHVEIKSKKPIEVHVLSTVEEKQTKWYNVSEESVFPIYIHSLKNYDGDEFLNKMNDKIVNNKEFSVKELLLISLSCFMKSENEIDDVIKTSAITITNIKDLNEDIGQFAKGVILMLCDKFVEDEIKNKSITNLVGGNMKNLEKYIERRVKYGIKKGLENIEDDFEKEMEKREDELEKREAEMKELNKINLLVFM